VGIFQFSQVGEAGQVFGELGLCLRGKAGCDPGFYNDDGVDGGVGWALPIPLLCYQYHQNAYRTRAALPTYDRTTTRGDRTEKYNEHKSAEVGVRMPDEPSTDPYLKELLQGYRDAEISELQQYLLEWEAGTYSSVAHSAIHHAERKQFDPLKYLRKAHNFSKKSAKRIPKSGYRSDGSAVYRKENEFLIVRSDQYGVEKIVTYGINEE
jgi:hypothetical protein